MALKGLDIFKLTPKTNCKDCGSPTCMAFAMKVAQGAVPLEKCPHLSDEVKAQLSEATAPPMKTIKVGAGNNEHTLGGETVLFRHEKTLVSKNLYAVKVSSGMDDAANEAVFAAIPGLDYERIGERMYVEFIYVDYAAGSDKGKYLELVKKAASMDRALVLNCADPAVAKEALEIAKEGKPILNGATAANCDEMNALAKEYGVTLGVSGADLNELHDTVAKLEAAGNKNLILDVGTASIKEAFGNAVQIRRASVKDGDRTFGYPSLVNIAELAPGDDTLQAALAAMFTLKYGSILVMSGMSYAQALPLYGLRQNIYTDPQKPMKVEPGIYPVNGADENAICALTVDFALTYFVVSGELERSGVPVNFLITDAGGYSVLTAWAAGKLSASSIAKFFQEKDIEGKIKNRTLLIPGKVAVLKGEIEEKLPGWNIVVAPNEAIQIVKFLKDMNK
ncbi:MAG TPA: acetyl-CoA decarbonylase/synthase complex subunit gamma [Firmicutes bacterium]|nr:acetyl-CoA decarbonylase/synthase complex subunit gamma [Bacillota bacterium]